MKTFSIAKKVTLAIVSFVVLAGVVAGYSAYTLRIINQANIERDEITAARTSATNLDIDVLRIIINLQYFVAEKNEIYVDELLANRRASQLQRAQLRDLTTNEATLQQLDAYETILPERVRLGDEIIAAVRANASSATITQLRNERRILDDKAREYLRNIIEIEERSSATALASVSNRISEARGNLLLFMITIAMIAGVVAYWLYRSIVPPLRSLTVMAEQLEHGNLAALNTLDRKDELGVLATTMNDMAREIQRTDDIKSHFIAIASHQLRTPATAVKQNLGLIIEGIAEKEEDKERFIRDAYESNEYQLAIIDDILQVARIEAGTIKLMKARVDIGELVEKVINEQRPSTKAGQTIVYEKPIGITAQVDATKLRMCVGNLFSNAMKYTPENGTITITVTSDQSSVSIDVIDTGVGIAREDMPKLFAKFSRVDNRLSAAVGGTGLGLYLVRQLARLHGGDVKVESTPEHGSTFIIKIPKE